MAANIPSAVVVGGGGSKRGLGEDLLLTLASAAPGMLMQFLQHRTAQQQQEALDAASKLGLQSFAATATPQEFGMLKAAGANVPVMPTPSATSPDGSITMPSVRPMTATNQPSFNNVPPGAAGELLRILQGERTAKGQQAESAARIRAADTQTEATKQQMRFDAQRQPLLLQQINEGIVTARSNRENDARRLVLDEQRTASGIATNQASVANDTERTAIARQTALREVSRDLDMLYSDRYESFVRLTEMMGNPTAASAMVFRTTKPPTREEFVAANYERATTSILTNQNVDPSIALQKAVLGDRPDVELANEIGLEAKRVEGLNQALARNLRNHPNNYATVTYTELRQQLNADPTYTPEQVKEELAKAAIYLAYKLNGQKLVIPEEEQRGFLRRWSRKIAETRSTKLTPQQQAEMDAALSRGAPAP